MSALLSHTEMAVQRLGAGEIGRKCPHIVAAFRKMVIVSRRYGTKRNNARLLLDFLDFCMNLEVPAIVLSVDGSKHFNVGAVNCWMIDRCDRMGGANSHKSWSAALTWFAGSAGFAVVNGMPYYQAHPNWGHSNS